MALTQMSYSTADKVIGIYSTLLMNLGKLGRYEKYAYSDLQGYDLIDISNALKLIAAYRIFIATDINDKKIAEFKKYADEDGSGLLQFFFHFYPDNIVSELKKLNPDDKMAIVASVRLTMDSQSEMQILFNEEETPDSFLDYCLSVGNSAPDYWEKIYNRIGITYETDDKYDNINFAIAYGNGKTTTSNIQVKESKPSTGILGYLQKLFKISKSE